MIILFDLDETLVNQKDAVNIASGLFLHAFEDQLPYDEASFPKIWWDVMQKIAALFIAGKISFQDQRCWRIREIFGQPGMSDEEADRKFAVYLRHYEDNWQLFPDVLPCLDSLGRYPLGVVTNGNGVQQRQKLARFGLQKYFAHLLISEEIGFSKPQRQIFLAASAQFGCAPADCVFVGDSLESDVIGSNQAGMRGIWLNRDGQNCADGSIVTIHDLGELKARVESVVSQRS